MQLLLQYLTLYSWRQSINHQKSGAAPSLAGGSWNVHPHQNSFRYGLLRIVQVVDQVSIVAQSDKNNYLLISPTRLKSAILATKRHSDFKIRHGSKESLGNAISQWIRTNSREHCAFW